MQKEAKTESIEHQERRKKLQLFTLLNASHGGTVILYFQSSVTGEIAHSTTGKLAYLLQTMEHWTNIKKKNPAFKNALSYGKMLMDIGKRAK